MKLLKATSIYEISEAHVTTYDLLYWASGLADELDDTIRKDKSFIAKKLRSCESYVNMHDGMLDRDVANLGNIRTSFWLLEHAGLQKDFDKAEKILREGLAVPNVSDKMYIENRLNDLLEEKNKTISNN